MVIWRIHTQGWEEGGGGWTSVTFKLDLGYGPEARSEPKQPNSWFHNPSGGGKNSGMTGEFSESGRELLWNVPHRQAETEAYRQSLPFQRPTRLALRPISMDSPAPLQYQETVESNKKPLRNEGRASGGRRG